MIQRPHPHLHDIGQLADKVTREFATLRYEKFAEGAEEIESPVMRLVIMKEG
jgi:hypothetical protein